jgi:hypothetical protein
MVFHYRVSRREAGWRLAVFTETAMVRQTSTEKAMF